MKEHTIYISKPIEYWVLEILVVKSHTVAIFFYVAKNGFSHLLVSSSPLAWRLILITFDFSHDNFLLWFCNLAEILVYVQSPT